MHQVVFSNGAITADQGEIRGFFSAGGDLVYDASSGEFSISRPEIDSAGVITLARRKYIGYRCRWRWFSWI